MDGYIITTNVSNLRNIKCDEVWLITRAGADIPGTKREKSLAPSHGLFKKYFTEWRQKDPKEWWGLYRKQFNQELQSPDKLNKLRELWSLVKHGKVIALVCYCKDSNYCHRSLVGDFLIGHDIRVEEFSQATVEDLPKKRYQQLTLV